MHKERLIRIALRFNILLKELFDVMLRDIADAFDEQQKTKLVVIVVNQLTSLQHKAVNWKCFKGSFRRDLLKKTNLPMTNTGESIVISLGNGPAEVLGFKTEEQIETALIPLMAEVFNDETLNVN